ncbi:MAG: NusA-like transcription termination signal-binding factor [archaeon]
MDSLRYIAALESTTGVEVKDCIANEDTIMFVVKEGQLGKAIGKNGVNVKKLNAALGKRVQLIEFSTDPVKFVSNMLSTIAQKTVTKTEDSGLTSIQIEVDFKSRGAVLGKGGKKVQILKDLLKRHHNISEVIIK